MTADAVRAALRDVGLVVTANHVFDGDGVFDLIDWAGVAAELGRDPSAAEISRAWLVLGVVANQLGTVSDG